MPRFEDRYLAKAELFSLGIDHETNGFYLSIPVANRLATYE